MKKTISILMSLIIAICMMPFAVFADEAATTKTYGPEEPAIENIEAEVIDAYDISGANALFYDNPVFKDSFALDYINDPSGAFHIPVRPKMDCNIDFKLSTAYTGNMYLGVWTATEEGNALKAVNLGSKVAKGTVSVSLEKVSLNTKLIVLFSNCGDYIPGTIVNERATLEVTATPIGDKPAEKCVHVGTYANKMPACCGENGHKACWVCEDCNALLAKNATTGEFREMTAPEKLLVTIKMPAKKHSFTKKVRNTSTLASKATCTKAAKYYYTCKHCGQLGEKTFSYGKKLGHKYKKNCVAPATTAKNGKIGTLCTRCKKVKKGTKAKVIYRIDETCLDTPLYGVIVTKGTLPTYTVKDVKGKTINPKYYTIGLNEYDGQPTENVSWDFDEDGVKESTISMCTIKFKGRYSGMLNALYVEVPEDKKEDLTAKIVKFFDVSEYAEIK